MIDIAEFASHLEVLLRTNRQVHQFRNGTPTGSVSLMPGAPTGFIFESCSVGPGKQVQLEFSLDGNQSDEDKRLIVELAVAGLEHQWARRGSNEEAFAQDVYLLIQESVEQGARDHLLASEDRTVTIRLGGT